MTAPPAGALEACPFCGSTNIDPKGWASTNSAGPACDDCGASAGNVSNDLADNIAAWNRRTHGPALLAALRLREECEGLVAKWRDQAERHRECVPNGAMLAEIRNHDADDLARILEQTK